MKKSEVYVKINSKKEAKQAKAILEALGEEISQDYWPIQECLCTGLGEKWYLSSTDWGLTKITLKQLIELLVKGDYTPEKTAVKVNNEFELQQLYKHFNISSVATYESRCKVNGHSDYIMYLDDLDFDPRQIAIDRGYTIIDYADFAKEKGLALKPTEVRLELDGDEVVVTHKRVTIIDSLGEEYSLTSTHIEAIHSAMKSLK